MENIKVNQLILAKLSTLNSKEEYMRPILMGNRRSDDPGFYFWGYVIGVIDEDKKYFVDRLTGIKLPVIIRDKQNINFLKNATDGYVYVYDLKNPCTLFDEIAVMGNYEVTDIVLKEIYDILYNNHYPHISHPSIKRAICERYPFEPFISGLGMQGNVVVNGNQNQAVVVNLKDYKEAKVKVRTS